MNIRWLFFLRIAGFALMLLLLSPEPRQGRATEEPWAYWDGAQRLTAQMTIEYSGWTHYPSPGWEEHSGGNASATFWIELEREKPEGYAGFTVWKAVKIRAEGYENSSRLAASNNNDLQKYSASGSFSQNIEAGPETSELLADTDLTLDHETGEWQIDSPPHIKPYRVQTHSEYRTSSSHGTDVTDEVQEETSVQAGCVFNGKAVAGAGVLQATCSETFKSEDGTNGWTHSGRVTVLPEWADVRVVVTLDAYDSEPPQAPGASGGTPVPYEKWRPRASMEHPGMAGNYIQVTAVLRPSDLKKDEPLPEVKNFTFELLDTSREPGIMMNWPRGAKGKDKDPDMRLLPDLATPGTPEKEAQSLEVTHLAESQEGWPEAKARIDSYDFGGRTELRVTAELADKRRIVGELAAAGYTYTEIRIPKRDHGGWVADAWKVDHKAVGLADDSDDETKPEGDGDKGDGFSLYEEYRGFAAKDLPGKRVEGDPQRKDLFVLNLIGARAEQGLQWFERESKLRTIYQLVQPEILEDDRVINFNYDKAPYRRDDKNNHNDQHAVVLNILDFAHMGHHGAEAKINGPADKAPRPKTVTVVAMPDPADPKATVNKPFNMPPEDFAIQYPSTIVHEMLHAVGVAHHGDGGTWGKFYYAPATYKNNPTGRPMYLMEEYTKDAQGHRLFIRANWVKILREKDGKDYTQVMGAVNEQRLEEITAEKVAADGLPAGTTFKDFDDLTQGKLIRKLAPEIWEIGKRRGPHSGNEICPMRYNFAEVYKANVWADYETYYLVPEGTEHVGVTICSSDKGTGVNDKDHKPQSRYGDAASHRGKCDKQINVNDAMPLHPWGWR